MSERKMSAASLRAEKLPTGHEDWFCEFTTTPVKGLGYEEGVHRRDPSNIMEIDGLYYVWYTKSVGRWFKNAKVDIYAKRWPWDYAEIWYATSLDGIVWEERGLAVGRGGVGDDDERTVCTPDCMEFEGKYYLVYQTQRQEIYYTGNGEGVGMAIADSPNGPWVKMNGNILERMEEGNWFPDAKDNYNEGVFHGLVHDPTLMSYNGKFHLYYKCGSTNRHFPSRMAGWDTRWGVAIADSPTGPFNHSEYNPITNSGHETMLWPYDGGIAALVNRDGPEKDTIQYAKDGINFEVMAVVDKTPWASGAFRSKTPDRSPLEGLRWGLCHHDEGSSLWNYIERFDISTK
ncbi:MAG: glycosyl hydrolase [Lachnospiraceae bacterium]